MITNYSYIQVRDLIKAIAVSNIEINAQLPGCFYSSFNEAMAKQSNWAEKICIIQYVTPTMQGRSGNTWLNWKVSILLLKKHEAQNYVASDIAVDWALSNSIDVCSWLMEKRMDSDQYTNVFDFDETTFTAREHRMDQFAYSGAEINFTIQPPTNTLFDSNKWQ